MPVRPSRTLHATLVVAALLSGCRVEGDRGERALAFGAEGSGRTPTVGLDATLVAGVLARADDLPRLQALLVARDGETLVARRFRGPGLDEPTNIKSASKSVLSALVGAAIARGVLEGVDQPVAPLLGSRVPADADPRVREITVGHLLAMRAGLEPTSGRNYGRWAVARDPVAYALARPFVDEPGGRMLYSTGSSHLLSAALTRASGRSTLDLAREWLGEPLGVTIPPWSRDPQGVYLGGNEMAMSARALLAFGELYRNGGVHVEAGGDSARVLPEAWGRASWAPQERSPWSGFAYGYGWWLKEARGHPVYFAWGYGGQMVFVVPSLGLTAVMTSDPTTRSTEGDYLRTLHALLDDGLIPAAERGAAAGPPS